MADVMRRRDVIFGAVVIGAAVLAATAAGDEPGSSLTPEQQQRVDAFEQAVQEAGLEDARSVRGRYVEGTGWHVERAERDEDGWTRYAPLGEP